MTTITCNTRQTLAALSLCYKVVNTNTVLPILEGLQIEAWDKKMRITGTDLETAIVKTEDIISCDSPVAFVIYRPAINFIKLLSDRTFTITVLESKGLPVAVEIQSGNKKAKFVVDAAKEFPAVPVVESTDCYPLAASLQAAISTACRYTSNDDLRPAMTGICFDPTHIAATDAHRLYMHSHSTNFKNTFIVSKKAALLVSELKGSCTIAEDGIRSMFFTDTVSIISRHIDARFPDYRVVIPTVPENELPGVTPRYGYSNYWTVKKQGLVDAINTVLIAADKVTQRVVLSIHEDGTDIYSCDSDFMTECSVSLETASEGFTEYPFRIAFNGSFLKQLVAETASEEITLQLGSSNKAGLQIIGDDLKLVMPLIDLSTLSDVAPEPENEVVEESYIKFFPTFKINYYARSRSTI